MRKETVGTIGLRALDFHRGEGTLGIIIRSDRVGCGLGSDAVRTLVGFGFEELGLERIVLDVAEDNTRAIRCYETVGFRLVGRHMGPRGGPTWIWKSVEMNFHYTGPTTRWLWPFECRLRNCRRGIDDSGAGTLGSR